jgi:hypothetical protein
MKITPSILSIPPYLSTPWKNIASLQSVPKGNIFTLIVTLVTGERVEVPGLNQATLNSIFESHAHFSNNDPISFALPLKMDGPIESLGDTMKHNPALSDQPDLPPKVLGRVSQIAKAFGVDDTSLLSSPEPDCNCTYCQIVRSMNGEENQLQEEPVTIEDLSFRDWQIKQTGEKLYTVTNPLDVSEQYTVFLGTPLGCNCGSKDCEHIQAVLKS